MLLLIADLPESRLNVVPVPEVRDGQVVALFLQGEALTACFRSVVVPGLA